MKKTNAIGNLALNLVLGNYGQIQQDAINDAVVSGADRRLYADDSMTSKLVYTFPSLESYHNELKRRLEFGVNAADTKKVAKNKIEEVYKNLGYLDKKSVKSTPCYAVVNALEDYKLEGLENDAKTFEALNSLVENDGIGLISRNEKLAPADRFFAGSVKRISNRMQKGDSPVSVLLASVYVAKALSLTTKTVDPEAVVKYEKALEPVVIALLDDARFANPAISTNAVKDQMLRLANDEVCAIAGISRDMTGVVYSIFHDTAVAHYITTIIDKPQEWEVGIDADSDNPMIYVDKDGTPKKLFHGATAYKLETLDDLNAKTETNDVLLSLMKRYQAEAGEDASTDPRKIAKVLVKTVIACDQLGVNNEFVDKFAFSAANVLLEIENTIRNEMPAVVKEATEEVREDMNELSAPVEFREYVDEKQIPANVKYINPTAKTTENLRLAALKNVPQIIGSLRKEAETKSNRDLNMRLGALMADFTTNEKIIQKLLKDGNSPENINFRPGTFYGKELEELTEHLLTLSDNAEVLGLTPQEKATRTRDMNKDIKKHIAEIFAANEGEQE